MRGRGVEERKKREGVVRRSEVRGEVPDIK